MAENSVQPPIGIEKTKSYPILGITEGEYSGLCGLDPFSVMHRRSSIAYKLECENKQDELMAYFREQDDKK